MTRLRVVLVIVVAVVFNVIAFTVRAGRYRELLVAVLVLAAGVAAWSMARRLRERRRVPRSPEPVDQPLPRSARALRDPNATTERRRYDVVIETATPVARDTVRYAPPAAYPVETAAGEHAAAALAAAEHGRRRPGWPICEVKVGSAAGGVSPRSALATGNSSHYRVSFPEGSYTVASRLGDFKAVALATEALLHHFPQASLEDVQVAELDQANLDDGEASRAIVDWGYEVK
ncbi:MAG: hypothetical protein M3321_03035 [Actinomycetota bacterium]|nr:hypothetical protein [Actinomycetota bacterium]